MARMSNRERIARAAAEAAAAAEEKAAKKGAKAPAKPRASAKERSTRVKIVWEVCEGSGKVVSVHAYPEKPAAEAEVESLTRSTGRTHILRPTKVPMD